MLDSVSILYENMQRYLYADLYNLEETHWWHKAKRELVSYFLEKYLLKKNNEILDVGCGTGKNIESFSKFGIVWGIDSSYDAINFCKKRGLKNIVKGNTEKIPFKNMSFECVTALDVLEHVNESRSIKEINRVLKKGGVLIVTVPAFPLLWSKWDEVLHHKRRYTKNTLTSVLERNGFIIKKMSYCYSFLFLPSLIIRVLKGILYRNYYPSDFLISNKIINIIGGKISELEKFFITYVTVPFGTSLIAVVLKDK